MLAARILLGKDFHAMFRWLNRDGFQANIPDSVANTRKSVCIPWKNGCAKTAGTSAGSGSEPRRINEAARCRPVAADTLVGPLQHALSARVPGCRRTGRMAVRFGFLNNL